jgi:16S rRNA (cytosine967-C5)-methyltransferase
MKIHFHVIAAIVNALRDVFVDGRYADRVIEHYFKQHPKWGARDRKLFAETIYEMVRWRRWHWHLAGLPDREHLDTTRLTDQRLWHQWAAYWVDRGEFLPPFPEVEGFQAFRVADRRSQKVSAAVRASIPDWLEEMGGEEMGTGWVALRDALNRPADVFLRTNVLKLSPSELKRKLAEVDVKADQITGIPHALRLVERRNVFATDAFREGLFEVQDSNSQLIAPFLQVEPGMRVVDACAGGGGKALHLACLMGNKGRIIALDVHDWKLAELKKRVRRAGVDVVETRVIEDSKTVKRLAGSADRVLLDVPCSGLGVLRRNPDAKWKVTGEMIAELVRTQQDILASHSRMTKPGGKLVYATCSILPSENEKQVRGFLERNGSEWTMEEELHLAPGQNGGDGFYAARLVRKP